MKHAAVIGLILLSGWMTSAVAQPGRGFRGPGRHPQGRMMAEFHPNDSVFAKYKLTEEQIQKVAQLRKQHQEEMQKLRGEMVEKQESFRKEMGKILSPEQIRFMQMRRHRFVQRGRMHEGPGRHEPRMHRYQGF